MSTDRSLPPYRLTVVTYALLAVALAVCLLARVRLPLVLGASVPVEPQRIAVVERRVDPNTASWAELAALPGIGEALAKRIVAYREEHQPSAPSADRVFRSPADLEPVKGIGPRLIERMTPHLRFGDDADRERERQRD